MKYRRHGWPLTPSGTAFAIVVAVAVVCVVGAIRATAAAMPGIH